ncbi:MAG: ATP synthase F0 subunit B [Myxococcota bacterium]
MSQLLISFVALPPILAASSIDLDVTVVFQFVNFALALFVVYFVMAKPYLSLLEKREEGTEGRREDAALAERNATMKASEYDSKYTETVRDAMEVRDTLRNQGVVEQQNRISEVRGEVGAHLEEQRAEIQAVVAQAEKELKARSQQLAKLMVHKILPEA